ncbi:MAG: hypothetical protein M2R45_03957 [Verrucomicrobia subdivision 3 bacterium]|nr:hypothetical protein [Limisphaerales bacterium]MCS1415523.1 hypothetical protein [Limisphaerales bacterium]
MLTPLFANTQTNLGDKLKIIAELITGKNCLANRQHLFFCSVGRYDTHQNQLSSHADLMSELSTVLAAFSSDLKAYWEPATRC